jgi:hypothetical protein
LQSFRNDCGSFFPCTEPMATTIVAAIASAGGCLEVR